MEAPHLEKLHQKHLDGDVRVLIIEVKENKAIGKPWADGHGLTFPVLLDDDGLVSASFAPKGVIPELPRDQVPIGSNLIIDREGKIQFYALLDTQNFDSKLVALREKLYTLIAAEGPGTSMSEVPKKTSAISLIEPELITLKKGNSAITKIAFTVKDGFHVLADAGKEETLIPMKINFIPNEHIVIGEITYPKSEPFALFADSPFEVYSGEVATTLSLSVGSNASAWQGTLEGQIIYQSCNERTCFPPDSLQISIPIKIIE